MSDPSRIPAPGFGSRMVTEALSVPHPVHLFHRHPDVTDPLHQLSNLVNNATFQLDKLDEELRRKADWAARDLSQAVTDNSGHSSDALVGSHDLQQINLLAARRWDAAEHLKSLLAAYQRCVPVGDSSPDRGAYRTAEQAMRPAEAPQPATEQDTARTAATRRSRVHRSSPTPPTPPPADPPRTR